MASEEDAGCFRNSGGERVLSIRLADRCPHALETRKTMACGHDWCAVCRGYVHAKTNACVKAAHPVVENNRGWYDLTKYDFYFQEFFLEAES